MPRKFYKNAKRQTPKSRSHKPKDMYRTNGYVPHADAITETAFELIKSKTIRVR